MKNNSLFLFILFICLICPKISWSQWQKTNGPFGGDIYSLVESANGIYACTDGGVYLSTNLGSSWSLITTVTIRDVRALVSMGGNIFIGTRDGVFYSSNNGLSWTSVNNGLGSLGISCLISDGINLFAGTGNGVYLSTDNGNNWNAVNNGLTNLIISTFAFNGSTLFAGTSGGGIYKSINNGSSWSQVNNGIVDLDIRCSIANGTDLYVGTMSSGIFHSANNGSNWNAINNGLTFNSVQSFAFSGTNIFASTNGGGIFLSTNNGGQWNQINAGLSHLSVWALLGSGSNILAGTYGGGIYLSSNGGNSWSSSNIGLSCSSINGLSKNGNNFFATTGANGINLSTDNGNNWGSINNGLPKLTTSAVAINASSIIFLGVSSCSGGIFSSSDNGNSWTSLNNGIPSCISVYCFEFDGNDIFAGTSSGIYFSSDNGNSWTTRNNGLTNLDVRAVKIQGNYFFAGTSNGGLHVSTDLGNSWVSANNGITSNWITAISSNSTNVFVATQNNGIFTSTDNGSSWNVINNGIANLQVFSLFTTNSTTFAGTSYGGLFITNDNGNSWTSFNSGLPNNSILSLLGDGTNLFAGLNKNGVWKTPFSVGCIPISYNSNSGNQNVVAPSNAQFVVNVTGSSPSYQWQELIPAGSWTNLSSGPNVSGETTASLILSNTTISQTNNQYRSIVSNSCTSSLTSTPQTLTVSSACIPVSGGATNGNQSVFTPASATFTVSVLGSSPAYQWQELIPAGTWTNLTSGPNVNGETTASLMLTNTNVSQNNYQYRCIVSNPCPSSLTSTPQTLTVSSACIPVSGGATNGNQSVITPASATFTVSVLGTSPAYQWQQLIPAGTWTNLTSGPNVTGETTASMMLSNTSITQTNYQYRCIVSNSCPSSLTSTPQTLTVSSACIPVSGGATNGNQSVISPASATFTVSVLGTSPNYQWQQLIPAGSWTNLSAGPNVSGVTSSTLIMSNTSTSLNNFQYRCIVTNSCPSSLTSVPQILTVVNNPIYWIGFFTKVENNEGLSWEKLIAQGTSTTSSPTPTKICADGSKATKIQVTCDDPTIDMNNIKFRIAGFSNSLEDGNFLSGDYNSNNIMAKVSYTHPGYVAPSTMFDSKIIEVYNQNNPTITLLSYPINIYRAPVLMVHGLWGNLNSFKDMEDYLSNSNAYPHTWGSFDNSPLLFRIDYEESNDFSFGYNSQRVPNGINSILFNARDENYSAGKVIVVAHSMGGILTRSYFENLYGNIYRDDIQKFITLNTPHAGTQGADMLWYWNYGLCPATRWMMTPPPHRTGCPDAIENLRTNSSDFSMLNSSSNLNLNLIPSYAIATEDVSLSDYQNCQTLINSMITPLAWNNLISFGDKQLYMDNLFAGESTDLIVPVSSQEGNISQTQTYSNQCHLNSPSNLQIIGKVLDLIDSPPTSSFFDVNGFTPTTLSAPAQNYFRTNGQNQTYSVEIINPISGSTYAAGSTITINTIGDNTTKFLALYVGNKRISDSTQISNYSTNSFIYSIPTDAFGKLLIEIVGVDSSSNMSFDTVTINLSTLATLDSMTFYPPIHYISKSDSRMTRITGHFSDGIDRDISLADGLSINSSDTNIASIRPSNFIFANDTGHTTLNYMYQSISKLMEVYTYQGEPWLTTNINETSTNSNNYDSQFMNQLVVFPNPTSEKIILIAKEIRTKNAIITVKDLFGKEVLVNNVENINEFLIQEINISGISSGVYLISASDGQKIFFNKFIKE